MLIKTTLDALLPFYKIHFSTSDLFSIFILKSVCQFWRNIIFEAISAFSAINVFSQQSKVLINSRPFKIPNNLKVYKPLYKRERFKGAFSFWKLMPLLLSRWCSQTLQKFHQRENYIKIILQTQTILTPHLRILYFHLTTSYIRQMKVICDVVQRMQISQFSANFTIFIRCHNVLAKLHSFTKFQDINVKYKRVKSCQYRFLIKYEHFNHFEHFSLDQLLLQEECVVSAASRNALCWHTRQWKKSNLFSCFRERGAELLAFVGMMIAKKECIGMKTNRWITSWHVVWFLISRWQPTVFWPMGDDDFLRWTSGVFFCTRESISWAESICPLPPPPLSRYGWSMKTRKP